MLHPLPERFASLLRGLPIRRRMILSLLGAIALPVILLTVFHAIAERQYLLERDLGAMSAHAKELAAQIDTFIDSNSNAVRHMALTWRLQQFLAARDLSGPWRDSLQGWLDEQRGISPDYAALYALDAAGTCVLSSDRSFIGKSYAMRPYYRDAMKGVPHVSDWSIGLTSREPGIYFSAPVRTGDSIVGVVVIKVKTGRLVRIIDEFSDKSASAYLLNGMGIVLAHRNKELAYHSLEELTPDELRRIDESQQFSGRKIPSVNLPEMRAAHDELLRSTDPVVISRTYRFGGTERISAIARLRHLGWTVGIAKSLSAVYAPAHRQIAIALAIAMLSLLLAYFAGIAITRGITRPLHGLVDAVVAYGNGDWEARAPVHADDEVGRLARNFNEMAVALNEHTNNLATLVAERTSELVAKNGEVLAQQKDLQRRNSLIEAELSLARTIQLRLIPSGRIEGTTQLYRPMDKVGGDFFDFVRFRDRDKLGVFISDVSGHGVPAAFITAMVKSLVLQAGSRKDDPAALMRYLNEALLGMTGDNFMTAFYAIYDRSTRTIRYANAGHTPTYLIADGTVSRLETTTGPPIALFSNERLASNGKGYETDELRLEGRGRLLLYTDGVTEALCATDHGEMFGDGRFEQVLAANANVTSDELVEAIYRELVAFRGGETFDDDVCIVCIDV